MKPQKSTLVLAALSGVPFIMVLGNSMLIPVLPDIKAALHLTQFKVSLLITLFSIPAGIVIPLAGFLSDRFGRKKVIAPALILYGLGGIVAGLAAIFLKGLAYPAILGGRILQGIGAAGTAPIAMALTGDLFTGKQRGTALGIIEAANGLGKVVSPILGALLGLITWYTTFLFFPLVVIPVVLGVWFLVREPESNRQAQSVNQYLKSIARIFEKKSAMLLTSFLGGAVALLILFGVLFFLSEHLETVFRLNGVRKGGALAIPVLFMSSTSYLTGRIIKKRLALMKWLVVVGLALIGGALTMMGFYRTTYLFFIAISLAGIGTGLTLPCLNTIITSSTATERRGLVTSLYGGVRFVGVALGPPFFGLLMGYGLPLMFWSTATLAGVAALLAAFLIRVKDMKAPTAPEEKNRPTPYTLQPAFGLAARKPWNPPDEQGR
jgi:ACDE family multidrug resistance protein